MDGNEFIDFNSSLGIINVGHNHPQVIEAIKQQAERFIHYSNSISYCEVILKLSKELNIITPIGPNKIIFYSNSEGEAIETGIKTAMWHTRN